MDEKYNMNDTAPGPQPGAGESATRAQTCAPPDPMPPLREEPPKKVRRAGTFTLGLVLVAAGVLLVLSSVLPSFDMRWALRLAPVVFIGLGIEVLIYAARPDVKLKYDGVSIFCASFWCVARAAGPLWAVRSNTMTLPSARPKSSCAPTARQRPPNC